MKHLLVLVPLLLIGACTTAMSEDDLKPWPQAEPGERRFVIRLPALDDESTRNVELLIGKDVEVDCNRHWFGGSLLRESIQGWGYPFYRLTDVVGPASTMMACPEGSKHVEFVTVKLEGASVRYNSKLPIVVYVPDDFVVKYRIWSAESAPRIATVE